MTNPDFMRNVKNYYKNQAQLILTCMLAQILASQLYFRFNNKLSKFISETNIGRVSTIEQIAISLSK